MDTTALSPSRSEYPISIAFDLAYQDGSKSSALFFVAQYREEQRRVCFPVPLIGQAMEHSPGQVAKRLGLSAYDNILLAKDPDISKWKKENPQVRVSVQMVECQKCHKQFPGTCRHLWCLDCCRRRTVELQRDAAIWAFIRILEGDYRSNEHACELFDTLHKWSEATGRYTYLFRAEQVLGICPWQVRLVGKDRRRLQGRGPNDYEGDGYEEGVSDFLSAIVHVQDRYREAFKEGCRRWVAKSQASPDYLRGIEEGIETHDTTSVYREED